MLRNYLNYAGSKDRYYPLIREFLEKAVKGVKKDKRSLIDMFCGSGIVSYNSADLFNTIGAFDGCKELVRLHNWVMFTDKEKLIKDIQKVIDRYSLSKENKEGFLELREHYNKTVNEGGFFPEDLYSLITHSFNYSLHLNKKGEFNAPAGTGRSYFSESLKKKLLDIKDFINEPKHCQPMFLEMDMKGWREYVELISSKDDIDMKNIVFFTDPPYSASISKHPYRVGELRWTEDEDRELFKVLDMLNEAGSKFIFTNVFKNNGAENIPLQEWAQNYNVHHVGIDYSNCNYQRLNKGDTDEVIIYNF